MEEQDVFECQKFNCRLTVRACAERRTAFKESRGRFIPIYPGCQECSQYYSITNQNTGGRNIMGGRIDKEKMKEMFAAGDSDKKMAEHFGVGDGGIWAMRRRLGLKRDKKSMGNKRKQIGSAPEKNIPLKKADDGPIKPFLESSGQVIPVTLRLNVEVNVRVNTERI
ncbi:MAG: hypothetical protein LLG40_15635 [Deltaproteobacteria bacterium]|nr:hypothetical protein [Deltaproteobacteria bacterium]